MITGFEDEGCCSNLIGFDSRKIWNWYFVEYIFESICVKGSLERERTLSSEKGYYNDKERAFLYSSPCVAKARCLSFLTLSFPRQHKILHVLAPPNKSRQNTSPSSHISLEKVSIRIWRLDVVAWTWSAIITGLSLNHKTWNSHLWPLREFNIKTWGGAAFEQ